MVAEQQRSRRRRIPGALVVLGAAVAGGVLLLSTPIPWRVRGDDAPEPRLLTQPLRLEVDIPGAHEEFLVGLRAYHYRAQPLGEVHHGYSYRFRTRTRDSGASSYSLRIEQEPRFVPKAEKKLDLTSDLADEAGDAIGGGDWPLALRVDEGLEAAQKLQEVLRSLAIDAERVEPRLHGELRRGRFDITDKGQSWFELDRELWSFYIPTTQGYPGISFEDLVVDTRLRKKDPELFRRVHTMTEFAKMLPGVRPAGRAPHERAIERLVGETAPE
jgi:hypothetical protein